MEVLKALADRTDVLLEGGPTLAGAFLRAGAIDRILAYVAPILLGGPVTAVDDVGVPTIARGVALAVRRRRPDRSGSGAQPGAPQRLALALTQRDGLLLGDFRFLGVFACGCPAAGPAALPPRR